MKWKVLEHHGSPELVAWTVWERSECGRTIYACTRDRNGQTVEPAGRGYDTVRKAVRLFLENVEI